MLQRYRKESVAKQQESLSEDEAYVPYVPVKERKKQKLEKMGRVSQVYSFNRIF